MICRQVRSLLSEYLDGDLNEEASAQIGAHLEACESCATSLRALRRTVRFIQAKARVDVPPQSPERSAERFLATLMAEGSTDEDVLRLLLEEGERLAARSSEAD